MKTRTIPAKLAHRSLDEQLGAGIDRAGRLVQDQQLRAGKKGAGDGNELLLADADAAAVAADPCLVASRQCVHKPVDMGRPGGFYYLVCGGLRRP